MTMFRGDANCGAVFSMCMTYRYRLWRIWALRDGRPKLCTFIMLNPSTADEIVNDPTVERCQRRARDGGFDGVVVVNLFALRSTSPKALLTTKDPIGPDNDIYLTHSVDSTIKTSGIVVAAWGQHGNIGARANEVRLLLRPWRLHYLKLSKDRTPAHPLYLPYSLKPQPWSDA